MQLSTGRKRDRQSERERERERKRGERAMLDKAEKTACDPSEPFLPFVIHKRRRQLCWGNKNSHTTKHTQTHTHIHIYKHIHKHTHTYRHISIPLCNMQLAPSIENLLPLEQRQLRIMQCTVIMRSHCHNWSLPSPLSLSFHPLVCHAYSLLVFLAFCNACNIEP